MKKIALLISSLLLAGQAISEDITKDFNLIHIVPFSCSINVANNEIEGGSLVVDDPTNADLTFTCTDLNGVKLVLSSQNGGLKKGEDATHLIHYLAKVTADHLNPNPVALDTKINGTTETLGTFSTTTPTGTVTGELEITLQKPEFTPGPGQYEDTLSVTLRSPLAPAS